jgi:hypothetical protein
MISIKRKFVRVLCSFALLVCVANPAHAVVLDSESRVLVELSDGTLVTLFAKSAGFSGVTNEYYFLPFNLHVTQRKSDGAPEFLFVEYLTDKNEDQGGLSGALMHFLVSWGPSDGQLAELGSKLGQTVPGAKLMGSVPLNVDSESGSFSIVSAIMQDGQLTRSQVTSGKAPALAGGKAAAAASLGPEGAQLMKAAFTGDSAIADMSIVFDYTYLLKVPGAKGKITIDWERIETERSSLEAEYEKTKKRYSGGFWGSSYTETTRTYSELRSEYEFMREKELIKVEFESFQDGKVTQQVEDAFFQYFANLATESTQPEDIPPAPVNADENEQNPDIQRGKSYSYRESFSRRSVERKSQTITLSANMSIRYPVQVVGNLKSWYDTVASEHPMAENDGDEMSCCLQRVYLNDPFFNRSQINLILDTDAHEIFDEMINYVGVTVRKQRSGGHDFEQSVTIDKKYLAENGATAMLTYAGGDEADKGSYDYKLQWGFRGGQKWPTDPDWVSSDLPDVLLAPPIRARTIEAEADIDQLRANDITRTTVQVHYPRLGKELEQNIQISTASGQGLVSKKIFVDSDAPGYAYRIILNHKRDGKLVLPWQANASDDYVYVMIPDAYLEEGSPERLEAKEIAAALGDTAKEAVLDKFEDLLN